MTTRTVNLDGNQPQSKTTHMIPGVWDARFVHQLINEVRARGEEPTILCLGIREAKALKRFLRDSFGRDGARSLQNYHYAGLRVVFLSDESEIRVETLQSIFKNSRHHLDARPSALAELSEDSAFRFKL